jgi:uncharacterized coiled-coil DUF342 family protein
LWTKHDAARKIVEARKDTDTQIRIIEHAITTLDSEITMSLRISVRPDEKLAKREELLEQIEALKKGRDAWEQETAELRRDAEGLRRQATEKTLAAVAERRRVLGDPCVAAMARNFGVDPAVLGIELSRAM